MIAIYTTFLRPSLVKETLPSYLKHFSGKILVLDQGRKEDDIEKIVNALKSERLLYYRLPFDCGLSYARNFGVKKAKELGEKYVLLTADSIKLVEPIAASKILSFLEMDRSHAVVGLELKNRVLWHLDMELRKDGWYLDLPRRGKVVFDGVEFIPCDVVKNFFIGKTDLLLDSPWNEEFCLSEHEPFFYELKKKGYKVFYTDYLKAEYVDAKDPAYNRYRERIYTEFQNKVKKKYGITGDYFKYSDRLVRAFENYWKEQSKITV